MALRRSESLVRTHNRQGGTLINLNIVSKETILAAHKDPSKFPELMVRVTGYSAVFLFVISGIPPANCGPAVSLNVLLDRAACVIAPHATDGREFSENYFAIF